MSGPPEIERHEKADQLAKMEVLKQFCDREIKLEYKRIGRALDKLVICRLKTE